MSIVANNQKTDDRVSQIDVNAVQIWNFDPSVYTDAKILNTEKLSLSAEKEMVRKQEDGTYHPADLVAHKMQQHLEHSNREALTFLKEGDEKGDYIFKHYKTVQSHQHGYEEMIKKAQDFQRNEEYEAHFAMNAQQMQTVAQTLN